MEFINKVIAWLTTPQAAIMFAALWAVSEFLASFPKVESNSVFQLVKKAILWLKGKFPVKNG